MIINSILNLILPTDQSSLMIVQMHLTYGRYEQKIVFLHINNCKTYSCLHKIKYGRSLFITSRSMSFGFRLRSFFLFFSLPSLSFFLSLSLFLSWPFEELKKFVQLILFNDLITHSYLFCAMNNLWKRIVWWTLSESNTINVFQLKIMSYITKPFEYIFRHPKAKYKF